MMSLYISKITWLHRWPAGLKLGILAAASLAVLPISDWRWPAAGGLLLLGVYLSLGPSGRSRLRNLQSLALVVAGLGLLQAWLSDWHDGALAVARIGMMVLLADLVSTTTPMQRMLAVFMPVLSPLRWLGVNTKPIALAFALMIRMVSVLFAQWQQQQSAWRARSPKRPTLGLLTPFVAQALRKTDQLAEALRARSAASPGLVHDGANGARSERKMVRS